MKTILMCLALAFVTTSVSAQKYFTKTAKIDFFSHTDMEDIKAASSQVTSIIDFGTGDVVFKMQVKTFQFPKALMQEHFNEKYLESDKFPQADFKGKIVSGAVDPTKDGNYKVNVKGDLTIHGVTKNYSTTGTITVSGGKVTLLAKFPIKLADHGVKIPGAVKDNISETVDVTVNADYAVLNK